MEFDLALNVLHRSFVIPGWAGGWVLPWLSLLFVQDYLPYPSPDDAVQGATAERAR